MSSRHRDEIRPPIAARSARVDPRAEPAAVSVREAQMACLARIALVRRSVAVEPEERHVVIAAPTGADFARPPMRPAMAPPGDRGVWCFRPSGDHVEVIEFPDDA
jgi:hypothetical protein